MCPTDRGITMWRHSEKAAICTLRKEASGKTNSATTLILDFQLPSNIQWGSKFPIWNHPVCGVLSRQPQKTNTEPVPQWGLQSCSTADHGHEASLASLTLPCIGGNETVELIYEWINGNNLKTPHAQNTMVVLPVTDSWKKRLEATQHPWVGTWTTAWSNRSPVKLLTLASCPRPWPECCWWEGSHHLSKPPAVVLGS